MKPVVLTPALLVLMMSVQPVVAEQELGWVDENVALQLEAFKLQLASAHPCGPVECSFSLEEARALVDCVLEGFRDGSPLEACYAPGGALSIGFVTDGIDNLIPSAQKAQIPGFGPDFAVSRNGVSEPGYEYNFGHFFVSSPQ